MALPTKKNWEKVFDPNNYHLFVKTGYNCNDPLKLGKLSSEGTMRQVCEGLGYSQPAPVRISIEGPTITI